MRVEGDRALIAPTKPGNRRVLVPARPTYQPDLSPTLVGQHPPAIVFFLIDPALSVKGLGDQGRVHEVDGGGPIAATRSQHTRPA